MTPDGTPAEPLVMPQDEFDLVRKLADATKACGCGPLEPCKAHMEPEPSRVQQDAATARTLLSGALLEEVARRVGEYENAITWNTSCLGCAEKLDRDYALTVRAEAAEAKLAEIRSRTKDWTQSSVPAGDWHPTQTHKVMGECGRAILAIISGEQSAPPTA